MSFELQLVVLALVGLVAGAINAVAGGGSFLSLPALVWVGLPENVANGSNRIGILLGNCSSCLEFYRKGLLRRADLAWSALPASVGALLGAYLARQIPNDVFRQVLVGLMIGVSLYTLWDSERGKKQLSEEAAIPLGLAGGAFFLVGIYAGFVQAGTGFFALAVTTRAGLNLVRGNAVKVSMNLFLTIVALAVFIQGGLVNWGLGLAHGVGSLVGGMLGAKLTILKGNRWTKRVVTAMIVIFAVLLLLK
ncbi:MAG: TSUP family transporter [Candidatus Eremiobacteraeota bacterium]|nr:TSUP family transporter [Candidatus Eremiobacteraeota bacterium]